MPWYYAGPEAKPLGPVSLEELHSLCVRGTVSPETYVIEHTGRPGEPGAWKRYQELFPSHPVPPPFIPVPTAFSPQPTAQPHPLFPSAASSSTSHPVFTPDTRPDPYYKIKPTNGLCAWGFGLALGGVVFSFACGVGLLLALPSILLCIAGLVQVHKHREQAGQGLAIAGLILSGVALLVSLIFVLTVAIPIVKAHEQTTTDQSSNDTD